MSDESKMIELTSYSCGDCNGDTWKLFVSHEDGKTFLTIICADEDCVDNRTESLDPGSTEAIVWDHLDITGQGYDLDTIETKGKTLN